MKAHEIEELTTNELVQQTEYRIDLLLGYARADFEHATEMNAKEDRKEAFFRVRKLSSILKQIKECYKPLSILLFALILGASLHAQSFYGMMGVGVVPHEGKVYFDGHLTFGREVGKHGFIEYNQVSALTSLASVPSWFQVRGGYSLKIARTEDLRAFVGSGIRPAYYNEQGKIKPCITYGFYLFQKVDEDFYMRYEIAFNNIQFMPSIAVGSKF